MPVARGRRLAGLSVSKIDRHDTPAEIRTGVGQRSGRVGGSRGSRPAGAVEWAPPLAPTQSLAPSLAHAPSRGTRALLALDSTPSRRYDDNAASAAKSGCFSDRLRIAPIVKGAGSRGWLDRPRRRAGAREGRRSRALPRWHSSRESAGANDRVLERRRGVVVARDFREAEVLATVQDRAASRPRRIDDQVVLP